VVAKPPDADNASSLDPRPFAADESVDARLARLEAELASAREQLAGLSTHSACTCAEEDCARCQQAAFRYYAGGEALVAKPRFEDGAEEDSAGRMLDFHMEPSARLWTGFHNLHGWGVRGQMWTYDNGTDRAPVWHFPLSGATKWMEFEAGTIDLLGTQRTEFQNWTLDLGGGFRYAWLEQGVVTTDRLDFLWKRFHGFGPVATADLRGPLGPLGKLGLAYVVNVRGSLLAGEATWSNPFARQNTDDIGAIAELQVGLEWKRRLEGGQELFIRAVYEHQTWFGGGAYLNESYAHILSLPAGPLRFSSGARQDDYDLALMGFAFGAGIQW
jgi:hypothetical protein